MDRYIVLLRGVNISGKNRIAMAELKASLGNFGYIDVLSYLNSGNIIFSSEKQDETKMSNDIRLIIKKDFKLDIPVLVIRQTELKTLLEKKPSWWGTVDNRWYDNLIFVLGSTNAKDIIEKIGEPSMDLDRINVCDNYIFWSFDRKNYPKSNWWKKTASIGISELITIRTANTLRKIVSM